MPMLDQCIGECMGISNQGAEEGALSILTSAGM